MSSARATLLWSLLAGLLAFGASVRWDPIPKLSGVMPEVDGVHPVRAAQAFREAFAPGGGFLDKYPPLASFAMGAVVCALDGDYAADTAGVTALPDPARRQLLWPLRERTQRLLEAERWVSRAALAASVALLCALVLALAGRAGAVAGGRPAASTPAPGAAPAGAALRGPVIAGALVASVGFGCSATAIYYADTTNVDAVALLFSLAALLLCVHRRWVGAAVAVALATAAKDPAGALGPVVLLGAWCDGSASRGRRTLTVLAAGTLAYAVASGALTGPDVWWQHVRYLFAGGISGVDRIDHGQPAQWFALLGYCAALLRGTLGWPAVLLGLAGLGLLVRRRRAAGWLLVGALLATPALFVLPIGFTYARFLLVPMAVLCAGFAVLLVAVAQREDGSTAPGRLLAAAGIVVLAVALDPQVADLHRLVVPSADARAVMAAALPEVVPDGSRIALFADEREHGPPLDPARWPLDVAGLDAADRSLRAWATAPVAEIPDFVLWMSFPNDRPSGLPTARDPDPAPGTRVGGLFEVVRTCAAAADGSWPVRSFAVRPRIVLMARLPR